jgi:ADP-ribose pyrophosphatase YjhB (NUDIX family)
VPSIGDKRRAAAVIMPIFATPARDVLFIERAEHLRHHPGQIGFPGGSLEPEDDHDLARAALREMNEEVGIAPERVRIIAQLDLVQPIVNRFDVTPFVAIVEPGEMTIQRAEIAGTFTLPLDRIISDLHAGHVEVSGFRVATPLLEHGGKHIWGVTGRILEDFVERYRAPRSELRATLEAALR